MCIRDRADTAQRLAAFRAGSDPSLPVLYFNFARYLLISSAGSLPPQLQDVYKRQPVGRELHVEKEQPLVSKADAERVDIEPVSYTHLLPGITATLRS